jgi:Tetracyclin repressor-like, C-terminal domain
MENTILLLAEPMENSSQKIKDFYADYLATHQKRPSSVYAMMKEMGEEEKSFYESFSGFRVLEAEIWRDLVDSTLRKLQAEAVYQEYSIREKMLAFCFTLLESLKTKRSFALVSMDNGWLDTVLVLDKFKESFDEYAGKLVADGLQQGELADRVFISSQYVKSLWYELLFVIAAVEKSVHLTFDLMSENILDSAVGFVKFLMSK